MSKSVRCHSRVGRSLHKRSVSISRSHWLENLLPVIHTDFWKTRQPHRTPSVSAYRVRLAMPYAFPFSLTRDYTHMNICSLITPQDTPALRDIATGRYRGTTTQRLTGPSNPGFDEQTNHSQCNTGIQRKLFRRGAGHGMSSGFILNLKSSVITSDINSGGGRFRRWGRGRGGTCRGY